MPEHASLPRPRHEASDAGFRIVLALFALIAGILVLMALLVWWLYPGALSDRRIAQPLPHFSTPSLQTSPRTDMRAFRAEKLRRLSSTGWVDQGRGIVHIPIEDAMRKVAQEGIPGWPSPRREARRQ